MKLHSGFISILEDISNLPNSLNVLILFQLDEEIHLLLAKKVGSHSVLQENKKGFIHLQAIKNNSWMELYSEYQGDRILSESDSDLVFDPKIVVE